MCAEKSKNGLKKKHQIGGPDGASWDPVLLKLVLTNANEPTSEHCRSICLVTNSSSLSNLGR